MAERVGIVGAGAMGAGIAQVALEAGHAVQLFDLDPRAIERATARIRDGLTRRASRLERESDGVRAWVDDRLAGLRAAADLGAVASTSDLVIEAAIEAIDAKRAIFTTLDRLAGADATLATNTSALSVTAIADATHRPERVLGLHFFNPAPLMPLVEVVAAGSTDPTVLVSAMALMSSWGKTPVRCADRPGFIVNRVNRPFTIGGLRLLERGEASPLAVDAAMRGAGFPMGPFELMDFVGIDVNLAAARGVWEGLGRPDRLRPSPIQDELVAAGHLGRKTGDGFYRYDSGPDPVPMPRFAAATTTVTPEVIVTRIIAAIDAEAALAADEGLATPHDIALALRLGAGHPDRGRVSSPHRPGA